MNAVQSVSLQSHAIRLWRYDGLPLPEWMPQDTASYIEANGTFSLNTELGLARVHPGNIVVEQRGAFWVRSSEDLSDLIAELKIRATPSITAIGPGKASQFGEIVRPKENRNRKATPHPPRFAPPIGSLPSIEWVHLDRLSVDETYQRTTDNAASRRLISSIAAKFDWRLCAPLVVARRTDDALVIIDGQHRWMAAQSLAA
ncbi:MULTISPECIES: ParB N-terminal domain-containing protein [unclassified Caulobacter]|uniref:ParB N-terminal domain-containing protein n=1 Tax=unclassified Caulobacter TaxID=2648921 RepID=UPI0013047FCA|nr:MULTISPECIES: ParB N-terminal domain-containing protein [unclassified Caulobacter]